MFPGNFKSMEKREAEDFLKSLGTIPNDKTIRILQQPIPFYKDHLLVELIDSEQHPAVIKNYIHHTATRKIIPLDWSNEPVYALNKSVPVLLTKDTIVPYVKFFFTYIKGKHGRFLIVDSPDEINWKDEPPPAGRKALAKMITPLALQHLDEQGIYHLEASMIFKDSLFSAKIMVQPDGHVILSDEELIVEDIPVRDDVIGL